MELVSTKPRPPRRRNTERFKTKRKAIASQQAEVLLRVRAQEGLSRRDLARSLNLAPSTVGIYVDYLVQEGFLLEGKAAGRDFGRPPTILALNPQGGRFIGVDFEARNLMAVAVDFSQRPLKKFHDTIGAADSVENILRKIEHAIETVGAEDSRQLLSIGVGVPGVVDPTSGVVRNYPYIKGWDKVPLVGQLQQRFGVPVFVENNIRSMALAELWFGQGRGLRNFICVGARSGLAAGIIIDGQVYRGADNRAGEIGDWRCPFGCVNGTHASPEPGLATLEEIVSFQSVQHRLAGSAGSGPGAAGMPGTEIPLAALLHAAQAGDQQVLGTLDRVARIFGLVLNLLNCAFNPEKIILAGVLAAFGDIFLRRLEERLKESAPPTGAPVVVNSDLGEFNGALGAAALAVHEWKPLPH